ncbi:hypothetical protein BRADI_1g32241v3 [Brachypodium distachyon]|uniref:BTB domain-containing protein n=1 Tax=Brachypodium distachyon TaxID=15368 RepID=A0A0Q3H2B4_BRADI|nr:hypothetical protein BRADI_1g32241v3 [Brachypodium distachyon]
MAMESSCIIDLTDATSLVRQLKIQGFSATECMGMDMDPFITSRWSVDGYDWEIRVYPARSGDMSLELVFLSESRTGGSMASMGCQLVHPRRMREPSKESCVWKKFHHPNDSSGHMNFGSDLLKLGYPRDDCLVLECTLTVLRELPVPSIEPAKEESIAIASPSTKLHQHLGQLLQSGTGGDVTFLVSGESFAAHKAILAARSPVFMAEFFVGDMKEKLSQRVEIEDMEASVFRALLHFIYTDTVLPEELDQQLDATGATMAQHLLAAADRYGLERLKLLCEVKLSGGITVDTAATTLALAEQHNCWQLKAKCMEFIVSTPAILDAVLSTEGYKHLEMSCPSVLAGILRFTRWGMRC